MSLVRYEPWSLLNQFSKEFDRRLNQDREQYGDVATSDWSPAVDIKENETAYTVVADIPGVDPKDIDVHMEDGVLTVKGERNLNREEEKEGYKRVERVHGSFYRRFSLPENMQPHELVERLSHTIREGNDIYRGHVKEEIRSKGYEEIFPQVLDQAARLIDRDLKKILPERIQTS